MLVALSLNTQLSELSVQRSTNGVIIKAMGSTALYLFQCAEYRAYSCDRLRMSLKKIVSVK